MIHCHTLFLSFLCIDMLYSLSEVSAYTERYRTEKWNKHRGLSVQKPTSIFLSVASRNFRNIFEERERERERERGRERGAIHALTWEVLRMATENEETVDLFYISNFMKWTEPRQSYHVLFVVMSLANDE